MIHSQIKFHDEVINSVINLKYKHFYTIRVKRSSQVPTHIPTYGGKKVMNYPIYLAEKKKIPIERI